MPGPQKGVREEFATFFGKPTRESLRSLLRSHIGETDNTDFKSEWSEWDKMAKHVLAFANTGGGAIFVGVHQESDRTFKASGVPSLVDKAEIYEKFEKYLPKQLEYDVYDFHFPPNEYQDAEYEDLVGKSFQVLLVEDNPRYIPYLANAESQEIDRRLIYVRIGTMSRPATYEEIQGIINRRIETEYSTSREFTLEDHLSELKVLYDQIPEQVKVYSEPSLVTGLLRGIQASSIYGTTSWESNPEYPKESYTEFIREMINLKKEVIRQFIVRAKPDT